MERYNVTLPAEETIVSKDKFIINDILPLCIRNFGNNIYSVLFLAIQNTTESKIFLQIALNASNSSDKEFLDKHILNIENIQKDIDRFKFYVESTKDADNSILYNTSFDMEEINTMPYFFSQGARSIDKNHNAIMDLYISRDNFIKLNLFFIRFMNHDNLAETIFVNPKLLNVKFSTIDNIRLDASATDISSRIVCNHYTCNSGKETYKFNFISRKIPGRTLKHSIIPETYSSFYSEHFTITDMIYEPHRDCIYIIYEVRSELTDRYKETKILLLDKEFYDKTNLLDTDKIYKDEEN